VELRYGLNPQQSGAHAAPVTADAWPVRVLSGEPSFINMLDVLNGWQLVHEASASLRRPAAASFKHVSPAGAAVAGPLDEVTAELCGIAGAGVGAVTSAYLRARDADPKSSYGDLAVISHPVDAELAQLLTGFVCDGIVAPGYEPGTVQRLSRKKESRFLIMEADDTFVPPAQEAREVFGLRLTQERDALQLSTATLGNTVGGELPDSAMEDLLFGLIVLRFTQSNSVCYVRGGITLGIGAGQQSRIDCTRLAGAKVDTWWLRRHPAIRRLAFQPNIRRPDRINWQIRVIEGDLTPDETDRLRQALTGPPPELTADERTSWLQRLDGVSFASDGFLPFRDNVDHAHRHGVQYIAEPGGSIRSNEVEAACRQHQITLVRTGVRLFHH
jgi:phosphoribosylaminoimidazolecarboxamide formyltransferase/IMP cyclohydrolase